MTKRPSRARYSFRVLLLLVTVLAFCMGWLIPRAERQKRVVEWIQSQGGQVYYRYQTDENAEPVSGATPPGPRFLHDLLGIDYFSSVDSVYLNKQPVDDLSPIRSLTHVRLFQMSNRDGELGDISPLANLTSLEQLYLAHYPIADVSSLRTLKRLKHCTLFDIDELHDVTVLGELPQLEELTLRSVNVNSLKPFLNHPKLRSVTMSGCPVSDAEILDLTESIPDLEIKR